MQGHGVQPPAGLLSVWGARQTREELALIMHSSRVAPRCKKQKECQQRRLVRDQGYAHMDSSGDTPSCLYLYVYI